jgi:putative endonuclease
MTTERKKLGAWGESVAATHLEANGWTITARNWRVREGEIDIVAERPERIALVEVKTRRGRSAGTPEEAITPRKAQKMLLVAQRYLSEHNLDDETVISLDVIAVELDPSGKLLRVTHHENAVTAW